MFNAFPTHKTKGYFPYKPELIPIYCGLHLSYKAEIIKQVLEHKRFSHA